MTHDQSPRDISLHGSVLDENPGSVLSETQQDDRAVPADQEDEDTTGSERRRQPELERAAPVEKKAPIDNEFEPDLDDDTQDDAARASRMRDMMQGVARQVSLDPGDDMNL